MIVPHTQAPRSPFARNHAMEILSSQTPLRTPAANQNSRAAYLDRNLTAPPDPSQLFQHPRAATLLAAEIEICYVKPIDLRNRFTRGNDGGGSKVLYPTDLIAADGVPLYRLCTVRVRRRAWGLSCTLFSAKPCAVVYAAAGTILSLRAV